MIRDYRAARSPANPYSCRQSTVGKADLRFTARHHAGVSQPHHQSHLATRDQRFKCFPAAAVGRSNQTTTPVPSGRRGILNWKASLPDASLCECVLGKWVACVSARSKASAGDRHRAGANLTPNRILSQNKV